MKTHLVIEKLLGTILTVPTKMGLSCKKFCWKIKVVTSFCKVFWHQKSWKNFFSAGSFEKIINFVFLALKNLSKIFDIM